jgi:hypothetical protein
MGSALPVARCTGLKKASMVPCSLLLTLATAMRSRLLHMLLICSWFTALNVCELVHMKASSSAACMRAVDREMACTTTSSSLPSAWVASSAASVTGASAFVAASSTAFSSRAQHQSPTCAQCGPRQAGWQHCSIHALVAQPHSANGARQIIKHRSLLLLGTLCVHVAMAWGRGHGDRDVSISSVQTPAIGISTCT